MNVIAAARLRGGAEGDPSMVSLEHLTGALVKWFMGGDSCPRGCKFKSQCRIP